MDIKSENSSLHKLETGSGLNFSKLEDAHEPKMWTIPSLTEGHLRDLIGKFPDLVKDIMKKHIIPFISAEKTRFELDNASISILGPNNQRWKIISGHGKYQINIESKDINKVLITFKADENKPEEIHCKEITKTFLGKCIIQKCGNEGTNKNEPLRKLLQATIDHLFDENDKNTLKNAKVYIYGSMEPLILVSGEGKNSFVINLEKGNPTLKCTLKEEKKDTLRTKVFGCVVLIVIASGLLPIAVSCLFMGLTGFVIWRFWSLKSD